MTHNFEAELREVEQAQLDAAKRGDADAFAAHFHQDMDVFWYDGRPLIQAPESQAALRQPFDQGVKMDMQFDDLRIRVFGESVAISTGNIIGTISTPDGNKYEMGFRATSIRVKEGNDWKIVHWHESPIQSGN